MVFFKSLPPRHERQLQQYTYGHSMNKLWRKKENIRKENNQQWQPLK